MMGREGDGKEGEGKEGYGIVGEGRNEREEMGAPPSRNFGYAYVSLQFT